MTESPSPSGATSKADGTLAFTPAPSRARHDGWTARRQVDFIDALGTIGVVGAAASAVGMSAKSAYALRKRAGAEGFAAAWDAALGAGRAVALSIAIDRAINGVAIPIFYRGLQVGERRSYDTRLLIAALRTTSPAARAVPPDFDGLGSPHFGANGP